MVQEWCCAEQQVAEETEERWLTRLDGDRRDDVTHTHSTLIDSHFCGRHGCWWMRHTVLLLVIEPDNCTNMEKETSIFPKPFIIQM